MWIPESSFKCSYRVQLSERPRLPYASFASIGPSSLHPRRELLSSDFISKQKEQRPGKARLRGQQLLLSRNSGHILGFRCASMPPDCFPIRVEKGLVVKEVSGCRGIALSDSET